MTRAESRLALSLAVEQLERALTASRRSEQARIDYEHAEHRRQPDGAIWCDAGLCGAANWTPENSKDGNGRYILLDALTALVAAQTALVNSDG